jgi:hypothetical protein
MTNKRNGMMRYARKFEKGIKGGENLQISRVVHHQSPHRHSSRGDGMEKKIAATYKYGKTTVHIIEPDPISEEKKEQVLNELHYAGWSIWNSLSPEAQKEINEEYGKKTS